MEPGFLDEIAVCFDALASEDSAQAVVLSGTDNIFSAGMDLKHATALDGAGSDEIVLAFNRAFAAVYGLEKPVIGALNGHAIAGGMVLALCCDCRIAPNNASRFGLTEVRVGVPFPEVAYNVIADQLRPDTLRKMVQFGENMDCDTALAWGAVDELVAPEQVFERALEKARQCLEIPPRGYSQVKRQLRGPVIERNRVLVSANRDKFLGQWIDNDARQAALKVLKG